MSMVPGKANYYQHLFFYSGNHVFETCPICKYLLTFILTVIVVTLVTLGPNCLGASVFRSEKSVIHDKCHLDLEKCTLNIL